MFASIPTSQSRSTGRILVVDDEPQVLAVAKAILESYSFEVHITDCGEKALHLLSSNTPNHERYALVLLDLTMPGGKSGFEVMEDIQRMDPEMPVIACSGYFQEDARDLCQAIGFTDVLQKPYSLEHLVATVRRAIARDKAAHAHDA